MKINSNPLFEQIWRSCGIFSNLMPLIELRNYILAMFFLKYISEIWEEQYQRYQKEYEGNEERIRRRLERERFVLPPIKNGFTNFKTLFENKEHPQLGELINDFFNQIESSNKKLDGIFRDIDFNHERNWGGHKDKNRHLIQLIDIWHAITLNPTNQENKILIADTFILLWEKFSLDQLKEMGHSITPYQLSKLVARLSYVQAGHKIFDPAIGMGGLVIKVIHTLNDQAENKNFFIYGQDINKDMIRFCKLNLLMNDIDQARIEVGNILEQPNFVEDHQLMKFHTIVSHPPFAVSWRRDLQFKDDYHRFYRGLPPANNADWAFISQMIESAIHFEGRIVTIVSLGALFRGSVEKMIRESVIKENLVDVVITLPEKLFQSMFFQVAILILDKKRQKGGVREMCQDILFIDASRKFIKGKNQNYITDEYINEIENACLYRKDIDQFAKVIPVQEVLENESNLSVSRYVNVTQIEEKIESRDVLEAQINQLESELRLVQDDISQKVMELHHYFDQKK
jgi:type I restriction enzyme M protein